MSHMSVIRFTQAVLILVVLRKGPQEVHEIANATGAKVQKVGVWLEAFHWAGIVKVKLSTKGEKSSFLWELNPDQEAISQRKASPSRIDVHKVAIAEFLRVILTSSKIIAENIDISLGMSLSTVRNYLRVLVEQKVVRIYLVPRTGKHGLGRRAYVSQLFVPEDELVDSSGELRTNHRRAGVLKTKIGGRNPHVVGGGDVPIQRWVTDWDKEGLPRYPVSVFNLAA